MRLDLHSNMSIINQWYRSKTGITPLRYEKQQALMDGTPVIAEKKIPRFTVYYYQYLSNMRTAPTKVILTESEYKGQWLENCLKALSQFSFEDNPRTEEHLDMANSLYISYGQMDCVDPKDAIVREYGDFEGNWTKEVAKQLASKAGSEEYQALAGLGGETPEEQAAYLFEHYSDLTPNSAVSRYFGLVERVKASKITEGILLNLSLPSYMVERFEVKSIQLAAPKAEYKQGVIVIAGYSDDEKMIYKLLDEWVKLVNDKNLPQGIYASTGELNGINNVSFLQESRNFVEVYPVTVSPKSVELRFREV